MLAMPRNYARRNSTFSIVFATVLAIYWSALVLGTHLPADRLPPQLGTVDKVIHVVAYAVLTIFSLIVLRPWLPRMQPTSTSLPLGRDPRFSRSVICLGLGLLVHAAIDESTQALIPGRVPSFGDWLADCLGVVIGLILFLRIRG